MAGSPRFLTKSRFSLAMECPAKLFYTGKTEYANRKLEDPFLEALAEGGFQVGEIARRYFPGGIMVDETGHEESLSRTGELMKRESVILFEPAFRFGNLFIRADILVKDGSNLQLIEVKAKSWNSKEPGSFFTKKGNILAGWKPYIYDVAFQTYVLRNALPGFEVEPFLMMADKSALCPTDGLNQKIRIRLGHDDRKRVEIFEDLTPEDLSSSILVQVPVGDCIDAVLAGSVDDFSDGFATVVSNLASEYQKDAKIVTQPGSSCRSCEFRCTPEEKAAGKKSGFEECWKNAFQLSDEELRVPSVLDVWQFRKKDFCLGEGRWRMADITEDDIPKDPEAGSGLSMKQRQWLQIEKMVAGDNIPFLDKEGLKAEMKSWKFPLHFIDFETAMPAIPFNSGRHPYEGIAFQFSHHVVEKDGSVRHQGQFIETEPGIFPNYRFLRALKDELEKDDGTIFRYAAHENTYLGHIAKQLGDDSSPPDDASELLGFICEITEWDDQNGERIEGPRNMIDMLMLVKRYYYDPAMGGSNSIKYVLPAILNSSPFLQRKYSQPIYGSPGGIPSLNFRDWAWVRYENGKVADPYRLLPAIFEGIDTERLDQFIAREDQEIREGGSAMMAWSLMQFSEMSVLERQKITEALLKYCELDTLAMVMIWEGWKEMLA